MCALYVCGCDTHADPSDGDIRVALPAGSLQAASGDAGEFDVLAGEDGRRWFTAVRRDTGAAASQFDLPAATIAIAPLAGGQVLALVRSRGECTLDRYADGGAPLQHWTYAGTCLALAAADERRAFVLTGNGSARSVQPVDLETSRPSSPIPAPAAAASLSTIAEGFDVPLLVGTADGSLWQRVGGGTGWQKLHAFGFDPVYAHSGNAIYALQHLSGDSFVAVIARPYDLQVRIFPVAAQTEGIAAGPASTLVVLERAGDTTSARSIACSSPLIAVTPYAAKHGQYFDEGLPSVASTLPPLPEPLPTGDQC